MDSGANRASGSNVLIPCVRTATSPETPARDGGQKSRGMVNTASLLTSNTDQRRPTGTQPEGSGNLRHSVTQTRGSQGTWDHRDTDQRVWGTWDPQGHRPEEVRGPETRRDTDQRGSGDLRPSGTQTRGAQGTWWQQGAGALRLAHTLTQGCRGCSWTLQSSCKQEASAGLLKRKWTRADTLRTDYRLFMTGWQQRTFLLFEYTRQELQAGKTPQKRSREKWKRIVDSQGS